MSKFMPGPWSYDWKPPMVPGQEGGYAVFGPLEMDDGHTLFPRIAIVRCVNSTGQQHDVANARLITAAPEMYAKLDTFLELVTHPEPTQSGIDVNRLIDATRELLKDRIDGAGQ